MRVVDDYGNVVSNLEPVELQPDPKRVRLSEKQIRAAARAAALETNMSARFVRLVEDRGSAIVDKAAMRYTALRFEIEQALLVSGIIRRKFEIQCFTIDNALGGVEDMLIIKRIA